MTDDPDDLAHTVAHLDPTWARCCPTCGVGASTLAATLDAAAAVCEVRGTRHLAERLRACAEQVRARHSLTCEPTCPGWGCACWCHPCPTTPAN